MPAVVVGKTRIPVSAQALILVVALLLRIGYVLLQSRHGIVDVNFESGDAELYLRLADSLLAGRGLATAAGPTAWVMPGYPLFLSGCFRLLGRSTELVGLIQAALGALACVWVARTTALLFSARAGLIAGLLAATHYELILWTSGQILTEPLYIFLIATALYALVATLNDARERGRALRYLATGMLFGLAALVRPTALAVAMGLAVVMLVIALGRHHRGDQIMAVLVAVGCVAVLIPWGIRNARAVGQFTLASTEAGHVLWLGNNPGYDLRQSPDFSRYGGYTAMFPSPPDLADRTEVEKNRGYTAIAVTHIVQWPGLWVKRGVHKMWNMWRPAFSQSSSKHRVIAWTLYPLLIALVIHGLVLSRRYPAIVWPLWAFLSINLAIHFTVTGEIRFRIPLWIALLPFAALSLSTISSWRASSGARPE